MEGASGDSGQGSEVGRRFGTAPSEATECNAGADLTSAVFVCVSRVSKRPLLSRPSGRLPRRTTPLR